MWHGSVRYPDYFYARIDRYVAATPEIARIKWEWRRFEGDVVMVKLAVLVDEGIVEQMARDISQLMNDGHLVISFHHQDGLVAQRSMCNGQLRQVGTSSSVVSDLFGL